MARRLLPFLVLALLAALPTGAHAASSSKPSVSLTDCDADDATATFSASMRTLSGSTDMAMRFVLQARDPGGSWAAVKAPGFGRWLPATSGRSRFVYDKTVQGLAAPQEYRVLVLFRWKDASGTTLKRSKRRSRVCVQPDTRPDLVPSALEPTPTGWQLVVVNEGDGTSPATSAELAVGGLPTRLPVPALAAGAQTTVRFVAAPCLPGSSVVATVDPDDDVDEADESANALTAVCPGA